MTRLRKTMAVLVLIFFAFHTLGIVNFAHAALPTGTQSVPGFVQSAQTLTQAVQQAGTLLSAIQGKASRGEDASAELQQLQTVTQTLQDLLGQLQGQLDSTAQTLQTLNQQGGVPADVLTQFESFRSTVASGAAGAMDALAALQTPSPTPLGQRVATALSALQPLQADQSLTVPNAQVDPTKLPHRRSDIPRREPEARPAITLGQVPPGPTDLAPTIDVPITSEIQALAAQHNFDPVALFAFVRNTIEFQPYFGSLKGAQGTLLEQAGNDLDQASLLIALLRTSNVPARYVAGTVELPIEKVMNWVGVQTPQAAVQAIASNGIPSIARTSADGTITHLVLFHVWAEAFLPQGPGHGAASRSAWVPLDPGFKQHDFTAGIDLTTATGFDPTTFLQGVTSEATINEPGSFFTNLNEPFIDQELTRLSTNLLSFAQATFGPTATVGDVLGIKTIKSITRQELNSLSQSFPFQTFMPQFEFSEAPSGFRHFADFAMFGFSKLFALPELAGKRVTVTYAAATPADQAIIDAFGGILNVFPAFLVNLKPQLRVEGQVVAEGQGVSLGSAQILRSAFRRPLETGFDVNDRIVTTGADYALALNLQRVSLEGLRARVERFSTFLTSLGPNPPLSPEIIQEALHLSGQAYFLEVDVQNEIAARTAKVTFTREPSEAIVSQDLTVLSFFGLPIVVRRGSVGIDVKRNIVNPISVVGDTRQEAAWMLTSGSFGSAAEHAIFEQLYGVPSVSTERLLTLANSQGVHIFTIDRTNLNQILPQLDTFAVVKQNIIDSVNAGLVAVVPQRNLQFNDWLGMGWIVLDPTTGGAGYLIAGLLTAGGSTSIAADVGSFNQKAVKEGTALKLLEALESALIAPGVLLTRTGVALIAQSLAGEGLIFGLTGGFVFGIGIAMVAIAVSATISIIPKLLATDSSRRRRWFAFSRVSVASI